MNDNHRNRRDEEAVLRLILEGTSSETGEAFFRSLVRNLADALGTCGAWVTEYLPDTQRLRAFAFWINGEFVEGYEHALPGTPCQRVVESKNLVHFPDNIIAVYPDEPDLKKFQAVSYMGVPLLDTDGAVLGHLAVLDTKPMPRQPRLVSLFEIFAARAAAEHRRLKAEQHVRHHEEQLSLLLESAMDAILVLDDALTISQVNPAAERLFGCTAEDLLGETMDNFLVKESAARLAAFARELAGRPEGKRQLWVPQDFVARRWDHSVFPAEATLSRFETRGKVFHTLILRNVDERREAERQIQLLTQETEYLREAMREGAGNGELLGQSDAIRAIFEAVGQVAATEATVLITGETGTGKELIARAIHRRSRRSAKPLVPVNCAAVPGALIESEFFGHERGAFTGATVRREGRFALAHEGTIFLDELAELPLELQAKLLRVLQEGEFEPLGSSRTIKVNVRVIAATNRDLKQLVAEGKFREDLYFRLNVFPIHLPPLRERGDDVALLAEAFVQRYARRMGKRILPPGPEHVRRLRGYDWPGNVRELQNVIERAIILSPDHELQLERAMTGATAAPAVQPATEQPVNGRILTAQEWLTLERENILRALDTAGWKVSGANGAARLLGLPPTTLSSRMKALNLQRSAR